MSGIAQTWQTIVDFFKNTGISEILATVNFGTIIGLACTVLSKMKKFKRTEIVVQTEKMQLSKETKETNEKVATIEDEQQVILDEIRKFEGILFILIQNSKISADAKQKALEIYNSKVKEATEVVKTVAEVVEPIVEEITKTIEEEANTETPKEENPYLASVSELIEEPTPTDTTK